MFDTELAFFIAHQDELVAKHKGKTLVLRGEGVVGAYDNNLTAYSAAQKLYPAGTESYRESRRADYLSHATAACS